MPFALKGTYKLGDFELYFLGAEPDPRDAPRFGIPIMEREPGNTLVGYIPSRLSYYFRTSGDVPEPHEDWYILIYSLDQWGEIGEEGPTWWTTWTRKWMPTILAVEVSFAAGFLAIRLDVDDKIAAALSGVKDRIDKVWDATAGIRKTLSEKIASARALYVRLAEFVHLEELRKIDHLLSLTWNDYYEKKLEIVKKMGAISSELFGDVHVLNQWLSLAGMIWKDYAAAAGRSWAVQDVEWFAKTNTFMADIEDELDYYARHPERLWIKIEDALVRPIYEARGEAYMGWDEDRAFLKGWIGRVEKFYRTLDRKVLEYQLALPDNIRDEMGPELIQFRKDLREVWKGDLVPIISYLEERLDLNDAQWLGYGRWKTLADPKITMSATLLSSPTVLTATDSAFQKERWTEIEATITEDFQAFSIPLLEMEVPLYGKAVREVLEGRE